MFSAPEEFNFKAGNATLSLIQYRNTFNHGTTVWDSSVVTAYYMQNLLNSRNLFEKNLSCIELGSGCGLLGLVMCSLGFETTLTDLADVVGNVLKENVRRNLLILNNQQCQNIENIQHKAYVKVLDWTSQLSSDFTPPYDYIVATDCIYSLDLIPYFAKCLYDLSSDKSVIICGIERRDPIVIDNFLNECKKKYSFNISKISVNKLKKILKGINDLNVENQMLVEIYHLKKINV
ncbi:26206_t:CDS:1 [Dentiscutata erythropus]|uniref:26206_t:CDS:1 n=1 Tax=Dentiscutata erythropus TaxID=1348616 RepID=A0A9N9IWM6_9GLOM|nr:26206_t:CDS:1 [Dentiscutata erythropus]